MEKQFSKTYLSVIPRIFWFCVLPHILLVCTLGLVGFLVFNNLEQRRSTPDEGFAGILLMLAAPYAFAACAAVVVVVSTFSVSLSLIRWRTRAVALIAGFLFLIIANVSGISAVAAYIYSDLK